MVAMGMLVACLQALNVLVYYVTSCSGRENGKRVFLGILDLTSLRLPGKSPP